MTSLILSSLPELSNDCTVTKFTSLVRARDEIFHFGVSPVNYSDSDIYLRGTGERRPKFEGSSGTKTLGNRDHKIFCFDFWGTEEQSNLFKGNKGIGTTLEGLSFLSSSSSLGEISERNNWRYAKIIQVANPGGGGGALSGQLCTDA